MPAWNEIVQTIERTPDEHKGILLRTQVIDALLAVSRLRNDNNVIFYSSAFLQKPLVPAPYVQLTYEDLNGLMSVMYGMDWSKPLTLILHTPGGVISAAESIVQYLKEKFSRFEVIVPTYAMSAGTMISLASSNIVMGRQSQLGPIDPQLPIGNGQTASADAIFTQFETAKKEVSEDLTLAHVWAPILQSLGPATLQEAINARDYGKSMVSTWLQQGMFATVDQSAHVAAAVAEFFGSSSTHKNHGRRINRDEVRAQGLPVEDLECNQDLQEAVLTAYHYITVLFEKSPITKVLYSHTGRDWARSFS